MNDRKRRRTRNERQLRAEARKALAWLAALLIGTLFFAAAVVRGCAMCAW